MEAAAAPKVEVISVAVMETVGVAAVGVMVAVAPTVTADVLLIKPAEMEGGRGVRAANAVSEGAVEQKQRSRLTHPLAVTSKVVTPLPW